ncbi:hypothetical protein J2X55_001666 [Microbacterium sp. 1154]|uniref:hypothetical protein n=1 Tax=Microbacterium sp. 1154 TaxID=2817733 RepID=UPI00286607B9|nr:hypothetical protein [Microbacterium sp. 1154]MDR6690767.1 hypothetical protein [Microbacterium sp. 1154]
MTEDEANYLVQRRTWFQFALRHRIAAVGGAEIKDERVDSLRAVIADIDEQLIRGRTPTLRRRSGLPRVI